MATEPSAVEQAVSRTLRENLESIQRTSNELHQAVGDFVAACASTRSLNALPPMIRAQMSAASLAATLEVLAGLVTSVLQPAARGSSAIEALRAASIPLAEPPPVSAASEESAPRPVSSPAVISPQVIAQPAIPQSVISQAETSQPAAALSPAVPVPAVSAPAALVPPGEVALPQAVQKGTAVPETLTQSPAMQGQAQVPVEAVVAHMAELVVQAVQNSAALQTEHAPAGPAKPVPPAVPEPLPEAAIQPVAISHGTEDDSLLAPEAEAVGETVAAPLSVEVSVPPTPATIEAAKPANAFDISSLPMDQQELHRRANRVAKVSMQDIKMLRPEDVRLGRQKRDLCTRLRDDIEKAHKEYDRRFQTILSHPVDYFYNWMVEILAGGESEALGDYPYHTATTRR
jgi:hypothetical protein